MKKVLFLSVAFFFVIFRANAQSAYFTSDSPRCVNDTMHFTPGPPGGTILQEVWDFGDGNSVTILPPATFPVFATHLYTNAGTYNVTRTVKFNNGVIPYNNQVTVIPRPLANFTYSNVACAGQPVQFSDLSSSNYGPIVSWNWNFGDPAAGTNNTSTLPNPSHTFAAAATYNVALSVTNSSGCTNTIIKIITINMLPVADFDYTGACNGSPTMFTDMSVPNAAAIVSYSWSFGDGGTSSQSSPVHLYAAYGIYNATLTVVNSNGCVNSVTKPVTVNPKPVADFTFPATNCMGSTVSFTDMSYIPAGYNVSIIYWAWNFGDGTPPVVITFPGNPNITHTFVGSATTHVVRLTVTTNMYCSAYIDKNVNSVPAPVANFSYTGAACQLQPVQFSDLSQTNGGGAIQSWNWNFGDPASGINNTSSLQNPSHTFSAAGTCNVALTVTNTSGCADTIMKTITINMLPVANFTSTGACLGDAIVFTDLSFPNAAAIVSFSWNFGDGGTSTLSSPVHFYAAYGIYNVTLTVVNSNGCVNSITKPVTVNPKPVADFSFPATNCMGSAVSFTDLSFIPSGFNEYIISWAWDFGDGTPTLTVFFPNNPNVTHTFIGSANTHVVKLTVTTNMNCSAYIDKIVNSVPVPVANFNQAATACQLQPVQFSDLSQNNGGGAIQSWNWDFGDPMSGVNNNSVIQNPTHIFSVPGFFMVMLAVANTNGCSDTISKFLSINSRPVADFTADTVLQGTVTFFTDQSYTGSGSIISRLWDFGDPMSANNTSTTANPTHLYSASGIFLVKLMVTDINGCVKDTTKPVRVLVNPLIGPPATRTVTNVIVGNGQTNCYNASQLITLAGNGTLFVVLTGGNATCIAGQKISILHGTTVQSGGYFYGYIATAGPWCQTPSMPAVVTAAEEVPNSIEQSLCKIFPNPTTGNFILEMDGVHSLDKVTVEIYGMWGDKVLTTMLSGEGQHQFSLSNVPVGVYFIRVINGDKTETVKIIKQ